MSDTHQTQMVQVMNRDHCSYGVYFQWERQIVDILVNWFMKGKIVLSVSKKEHNGKDRVGSSR